MGYYLNSEDAYELYESETRKAYFIDKTEMLKDLIQIIDQGEAAFPSPDRGDLENL
ncbi:MAG: hypothetical protein LUF35_00090 [Lachnospiraceae bacterium]|nr:hypothetical protein [Lachnospiraceae bacterium]